MSDIEQRLSDAWGTYLQEHPEEVPRVLYLGYEDALELRNNYGPRDNYGRRPSWRGVRISVVDYPCHIYFA